MSRTIKESAVGVVDGVNTDFETSRDYRPGSVVPFVDGLAWPGGATELGFKSFRLSEAPLEGSEVAVYYRSIL